VEAGITELYRITQKLEIVGHQSQHAASDSSYAVVNQDAAF
jgi:hypothetical protein